MLYAFSSRASNEHWLEFEFIEDVIITGLVVTVANDSTRIESMRLRANKNKNLPYLLETVLPDDVVRAEYISVQEPKI